MHEVAKKMHESDAARLGLERDLESANGIDGEQLSCRKAAEVAGETN